MVRKKVPFYSLMFSCLVILSPYVMQEERDTQRKARSNNELEHGAPIQQSDNHLCFSLPLLHYCHRPFLWYRAIIYICSVIFTIPSFLNCRNLEWKLTEAVTVSDLCKNMYWYYPHLCTALRTVGPDLHGICACYQNRREGHHQGTVSCSTGASVDQLFLSHPTKSTKPSGCHGFGTW